MGYCRRDDCVNGARYLVGQASRWQQVDDQRRQRGRLYTLCALTFETHSKRRSHFGVSDLRRWQMTPISLSPVP